MSGLESCAHSYNVLIANWFASCANGKVIGKSDKLDFFTTNVDISDMSGGQIAMSKAYLSIGDSWEVNINSSIDRRLVIFIPAFISLAQSEKK